MNNNYYYIHSYEAKEPTHEIKYNTMDVFCKELDDKHLFKHTGDKSGFETPEKYRIRHTHIQTLYKNKKKRKKQNISSLINDTLCIDDFFSDTEDVEGLPQLATVDNKKSNDMNDSEFKPTSTIYEQVISSPRKKDKNNLSKQETDKIAKWEDKEWEQKVKDTLVM